MMFMVGISFHPLFSRKQAAGESARSVFCPTLPRNFFPKFFETPKEKPRALPSFSFFVYCDTSCPIITHGSSAAPTEDITPVIMLTACQPMSKTMTR